MRGAYSRNTSSGVSFSGKGATMRRLAGAGRNNHYHILIAPPRRPCSRQGFSSARNRADERLVPNLPHERRSTMAIRATLFDFDGTLADSFAPITASTNHVRTSYGLPPLPEAEVRKYVGYGLTHLMTDLVPGAPADEAVERYRAHHATVMLAQTRLMPGVAEIIPELARRGLCLGVCSNKRVEFTRKLVQALGLQEYFACVLGPDDVGNRAKPDPAMLLEGLGRLGVSPAEAVYVGDMLVDVQTGRAAGVPVWLICYDGTGEFAPVDGAAPDRVLHSFAELTTLLAPVRK
jgi:phosphoglycolate phosphatase